MKLASQKMRAPLAQNMRFQRIVARGKASGERWPVMYKKLTDGSLKIFSPEEAREAVTGGQWVLIDVRPKEAYDESHPEGALSIPLYRKIDLGNASAMSFVKTILYASMGVNPVEANPNFESDLTRVCAGKDGVIFCCEAGGTLKPSVNFQEGKASRSLQACYVAMQPGKVSGKVGHLDRGLYGWFMADLPMVGEYTPDLGRTPQAAQDPTIKSIAQSNGYEMREGDQKKN